LGTLSSYVFQQKVANIQNTVPVVIETLNKLDNIKKALKKSTKDLEDAEKKMQSILSDSINKEIELDKLSIKLNNLKSQLEKKLKNRNAVPVDFNLSSPDDLIKISSFKNEKFEKKLNMYKEMYAELAQVENESDRLFVDVEEARSTTSKFRNQKYELDIAQKKLLSKYESLPNHLNELEYLREWKFDLLAKMPDQLLTLLLALSMGALGSVIYLTRTFLDPKSDKPFKWYVFRPILGMVTALAIFILAKAGQIIISDNSMSPGISNKLNPFFISFLSIISGVLSEQAYEKIHSSGATFFHVEIKDNERWAFELNEELKNKGKEASEIAILTGAPLKVVNEWIEERLPVPEMEQKIIAAWLDKNIRDLFRDLPPPSPI
ncbi:MAG: hypothetical protein KAR45_13320, partial [Desulfobacteraceae bacterium]|nr:hypothetical protein [Desulfobacteraceae bacterium]